jgi:hypothetical protein
VTDGKPVYAADGKFCKQQVYMQDACLADGTPQPLYTNPQDGNSRTCMFQRVAERKARADFGARALTSIFQPRLQSSTRYSSLTFYSLVTKLVDLDLRYISNVVSENKLEKRTSSAQTSHFE